MATKVSNCSGTEYGGASGGVAGDQTGHEVHVIPWYYYGQIAVYRHPDPKVRSELARLGRETAENPHVGYDQGGRLTFRNALRKVNYAPLKISTDCETDCSACTAALIEAVGALLGIQKLYDFDTTLSTHYMDAPLVAVGFQKLTGSKYTDTGDYLLSGDISLNPGKHVNIAVTDGSRSGGSSEPTWYPAKVPFSFTFNRVTRVRTSPDTSTDANLRNATWDAGDTAVFDGIAFGSGYVWGTYVGATTGLRLFSAMGTHEMGSAS